MPSPIYLAYSPVVTFVDDIGGAGGTPLSAANFNGLRSDLVTYVETHYQGIANNHDIADIESWNGATPLTEAMAYQNIANAHYTLDQRLSMILNTLSVLTGGAGTLTAQLATLAGLTEGNLNALATTVGTATTLATPNTVVKRDGGGGAQFVALAAAPTGTTVGMAVAAPSGYTGVPFLYTLNGVNKFSVDSNGNVIAPTYSGTFFGTLTGNAGGLAAPVAFTSLVSDYKIVPSGVAGTVNVSAGGGFGDSALNRVPPKALQSVPLPTQPTGTNIQFCVISAQPGTATARVTASTASATGLPIPQYPSGDVYLGTVTWRGATTLPSGIVAAGDIEDGRFPGSGSVSSGGGTGGAPTAARYWLFGTTGDAGLSNPHDSTNSADGGWISAALIKGDAGSVGFDQLLNVNLQPDTASRISATGAVATLYADASSPWTFYANGLARQVTASLVTAAATGAAGPRYLKADLGSGSLVLSLTASNATTATSRILAVFPWNGTSLLPDAFSLPDLGNLGNFPLNSVAMNEIYGLDSGSNATVTPTTTPTAFSNFTPVQWTPPVQERALLVMHCAFDITVATGDKVYVVPMIDGAAATTTHGRSIRPYTNNTVATATEVYVNASAVVGPFTPNLPHTFAIGCFKTGTGASSMTVYGNFAQVSLIAMRG